MGIAAAGSGNGGKKIAGITEGALCNDGKEAHYECI